MFLLKTISKHYIDIKHVLHIKVGTIHHFTDGDIRKLCSESTICFMFISCSFVVLSGNILIIYNNNYQSCFLSENIRNILISV